MVDEDEAKITFSEGALPHRNTLATTSLELKGGLKD